MAIKRTNQSTDEQLNLDINNGDLAALKAAKDSFGLADEEAVFRFALAVLSQARGDTLYIDDGTGTKTGLKPSESLKEHPSDANPT